MTKEEAIEALRAHLKPGESILVEGKALESLSGTELFFVYAYHSGSPEQSMLAAIMADRRREVERLRERWGMHPINWHDVAEHLGVEVEP